MCDARWCTRCQRAWVEDSLARDAEGMPHCPHCGANSVYLQRWRGVRSYLKDAPQEPLDGARYEVDS
jgi:hypothetical protein